MRVIFLTSLILLLFSALVSGGDKQKAAFDSMDTDKDGQISQQEFEQRCAASGIDEAVAFTQEDDLDHDGMISLEEFGKKWKDSGADAVAFKLEDIDVNKDGVVTWKELQLHYPGSMKAGFNSADADKNGSLSQKESLVLFRF